MKKLYDVATITLIEYDVYDVMTASAIAPTEIYGEVDGENTGKDIWE